MPVVISPLPRSAPRSMVFPVLSGFAKSSTWSKSAGMPPSSSPSHLAHATSNEDVADTPIGRPGGVVSPTNGMRPPAPGMGSATPPPSHVCVPSPLSTAMVPVRQVECEPALAYAALARASARESSAGLISM